MELICPTSSPKNSMNFKKAAWSSLEQLYSKLVLAPILEPKNHSLQEAKMLEFEWSRQKETHLIDPA